VFSALAASIDGYFKFCPSEFPDVGVLEISMDAKILINDGQHRKAAILEAISEDESLLNETISVVFFEDQGLARSQQMFTDLNKHAVKTSNSIAELYDSRANKLAQKAKDALKSGSDLKAIAASLGDTEVVSYEKTDDFMSDATLDGGRAIKAKGLKAGEVSEMFTSRKGDCYYFVKLIEEKDGKVKYESLEIRFTEFDKTFAEIKNSDKIKEYIEVSDGTSGEEIDLNPEIK
jgi:DGQHR domain-containing protein